MNRNTNRRAALAVALLGALANLSCDDGLGATESSDILLTPPHESELLFPRTRPGRTSMSQVIEISHGGADEVPLIIREIYVERFDPLVPNDPGTPLRDCDLVTQGKTPAEFLDEPLASECQLLITERPDDEAPEKDTEIFRLIDGQKAQISVQYRPTEGADLPENMRVVVVSNVRDKETRWIQLSVQRASPRIFADPPVISFAGASPGQQEFIFIKNTGTGDLRVDTFTLQLQSEPARDANTGDTIDEFIVSADNALPWIIREGGAETVVIQYQPCSSRMDVNCEDNAGADRATLVFESNDEDTPRLDVSITSEEVFGLIEISPNPVVFNEPPAGAEVEEIISVTNSGLAPVDVTGIVIEQPGSDYRLNAMTSFRLQGDGSQEIAVVYRPQTAEGSDATLVVTSNAANAMNGETRVLLTREGQSLPPLLSIDPTTVNLETAAGESEDTTITLENIGDQPLEISRIEMSGEGDAGVAQASDPEFSVTSGGMAITLTPGDTHEVVVNFARPADDMVQHVGTLIIESNAATSPDLVRFLSAE